MVITFNKKEFLKAIKRGGCFAGSRKVLPILECVKITIKGDKCWILSYDDRNAIKTSCPVSQADGDICFCICKDDIEKYVLLINEDSFIIEVNNKERMATIITLNGKMKFPLFDPNMYPLLNVETTAQTFDIEPSLLGYWISKGARFLYNDDMQLNHQNMHIIIKDRKIDVFFFGFNKMYHDSNEIDTDIELSLSIDRNSFFGIMKAIEDSEKMTIKSGERNTTIICDNSMLLIRKDEFKMHNYFMLLEYKPMFEVVVNTKDLLSVVNRALNIYDDVSTGTIKFTFEKDFIEVKASNFEGTKTLSETIHTEGGEPFEQIYGANLLALCLSAISSDTAIISPTGERGLVKIKNPEYETEATFTTPYSK